MHACPVVMPPDRRTTSPAVPELGRASEDGTTGCPSPQAVRIAEVLELELETLERTHQHVCQVWELASLRTLRKRVDMRQPDSAPGGATRAVNMQELHTALSTLSARDAELRDCREQVGTRETQRKPHPPETSPCWFARSLQPSGRAAQV
jgi:hypothetical protein